MIFASQPLALCYRVNNNHLGYSNLIVLSVQYTTDVLEAFSSFKLEGDSSSKEGGADGGPRTYSDNSDMQDCDQTIVDSLPDVKKVGPLAVVWQMSHSAIRPSVSCNALARIARTSPVVK